MEALTLLSPEASENLVKALMDLVEREAEKRMLQREKRYLMQKEVYEQYECNPKILQHWEEMGLKKFKHGKRWLYDRRDIEEVIEKIKI